MEIQKLNETEFEQFIQNDYVLVDFYATWCGPCKMMHPVLEELSNTRASVKVAKVDVDECQNLAKRFGVMSIPTLILFKKGEVVDTKLGYQALPLLEKWINENQ